MGRLKGFCNFLIEPHFKRHSLKVEYLLRFLTENSGDPVLSGIFEREPPSRAFSYLGLAWGFTRYTKKDGRIWIGLHRLLLLFPKCSFTIFIAGHELGHAWQFLSGQVEQPINTRKLYDQELQASEIGVRLIEHSNYCTLPFPFRSKLFQRFCAFQSAYPLIALLFGGPVILVVSLAAANLSSKISEWILNRWYASSAALLANPHVSRY